MGSSIQAEEKEVAVVPLRGPGSRGSVRGTRGASDDKHDASRGGSSLRTIADGFGEIYPQLRSMASVLMRQERASHTLQPTAIVSEAFLRLAHRDASEFASSSNLLAVAAHAMRCVLVDHARSRGAAKRGASRRAGDAALAFVAASTVDPAEVLAIDEALAELAEMDERAARVLECKAVSYTHLTLPTILRV